MLLLRPSLSMLSSSSLPSLSLLLLLLLLSCSRCPHVHARSQAVCKVLCSCVRSSWCGVLVRVHDRGFTRACKRLAPVSGCKLGSLSRRRVCAGPLGSLSGGRGRCERSATRHSRSFVFTPFFSDIGSYFSISLFLYVYSCYISYQSKF